jgi:hypothetical protein
MPSITGSLPSVPASVFDERPGSEAPTFSHFRPFTDISLCANFNPSLCTASSSFTGARSFTLFGLYDTSLGTLDFTTVCLSLDTPILSLDGVFFKGDCLSLDGVCLFKGDCLLDGIGLVKGDSLSLGESFRFKSDCFSFGDICLFKSDRLSLTAKVGLDVNPASRLLGKVCFGKVCFGKVCPSLEPSLATGDPFARRLLGVGLCSPTTPFLSGNVWRSLAKAVLSVNVVALPLGDTLFSVETGSLGNVCLVPMRPVLVVGLDDAARLGLGPLALEPFSLTEASLMNAEREGSLTDDGRAYSRSLVLKSLTEADRWRESLAVTSFAESDCRLSFMRSLVGICLLLPE